MYLRYDQPTLRAMAAQVTQHAQSVTDWKDRMHECLVGGSATTPPPPPSSSTPFSLKNSTLSRPRRGTQGCQSPSRRENRWTVSEATVLLRQGQRWRQNTTVLSKALLVAATWSAALRHADKEKTCHLATGARAGRASGTSARRSARHAISTVPVPDKRHSISVDTQSKLRKLQSEAVLLVLAPSPKEDTLLKKLLTRVG